MMKKTVKTWDRCDISKFRSLECPFVWCYNFEVNKNALVGLKDCWSGIIK